MKKKIPNRKYSDLTAGNMLEKFFEIGFPSWVKVLRGESGVYVIRRKSNKEILYVGESHSGKLYETFTRHFQSWSGPTAGVTYSKSEVQAAIFFTKPAAAVDLQNELICKLGPRDNDLSPGCEIKGDDNPF